MSRKDDGFSLIFTRRFCMAHRLIEGCSETCAVPHGHNEYVSVVLTAGPNNPNAGRLNGRSNMLLLFAQAKTRWHRFIDEAVDHCFQLSNRDPLLEYFQKHEPKRLSRIMVTPGDPTTELLAALLLSKLSAFLREDGGFLKAETLEIRETPTNTVRLTTDSVETYLPQSRHKNPWWTRPDFSLSDPL